ncbi:CinA family protein [Parasedimentitalea huanghaiensis]|uniref:Nicotinamide-nucleotide amidohydrolase family protein n=1 Tax=Parasedimentitalea huanghaiensis TaxID=2682100 RepID=A0A6L6WC58_9RHOB|nr:nicotinamide-nucleotide amidohydrolase family protein [Zongyanglinia huanghaiensis]MVO14429.1 nicotinamide-nucleotide amidohydrolase family protein [Zongyanglinia huanghaiensis]
MTVSVSDLVSTARLQYATIATAESCTGGLVSAALTGVPGSSAVFSHGYVTYSNSAKTEMLGVSVKTLADFGAVSPEVAAEMALGALRSSGATIAVSISGIAGPGGSDHKPEGRVCFGLAITDQKTITKTLEFGALGRQNVREAACKQALELLHNAVHDMNSHLQK